MGIKDRPSPYKMTQQHLLPKFGSDKPPAITPALLPNQNDNGCWYGTDGESRVYGPVYGTSMAVLALTVEYRFLPIYQRNEEAMEKGK